MRYVKQKILYVTEFDSQINDEETILQLLENLSKISVDIQMSYRDEKIDQSRTFNNVRVIALNRENKTFDIRIIYNTSSSVIKNILIKNIECVKVKTERNIISIEDPEASCGKFIDIGEEK